MLSHGLDPALDASQPHLTGQELAQRQDALGRVLAIAAPELDCLFELVGSSGCGVVLTDGEGVIVDHRFSDADKSVFEGWGLGVGAVWSEATVGTNGIGTCITEERAVTIHRDEHFLARNTGMSCIDAPIFGADGQLVAALDVSSARADQTKAINGLIAEMVARVARTVEVNNFRASYPKARIIIADQDDTSNSTLLAVDQDDVVIGATRRARKAYGFAIQGAFTPIAASDLFGRGDGPVGLEKAERAAVVRALVRANNNVSDAARDLNVSRATLYRRMKRLGLSE
ncbi:GAF domain-containing protein [Lentibacter algarum]|nr:GAF domain-containing protein [Lentibacter algarum]MBU2982845.1 GAF domain-containing protein [Lentibacter algarum]